MELSINGKTVDLSRCVPLTLGDFRRLKKDHQVEQKDLGLGDIEVTARFMLYMLKKADASITEADVDALTMDDMTKVMTSLASGTTSTDRAVDRPT